MDAPRGGIGRWDVIASPSSSEQPLASAEGMLGGGGPPHQFPPPLGSGAPQRPPREVKGRMRDNPRNPRSREDRPWRYFEKIVIESSSFPPHVRPAAVIIGVRGSNHARMQDESACCVQLRGRGISSAGTPGADEPMHLWVKYDEHHQLDKVKEVLSDIIRSCDFGPPPEARRTTGAGGRPNAARGGAHAGVPRGRGRAGVAPPETPEEFLFTLHLLCHSSSAEAQVGGDPRGGIPVEFIPEAYNLELGFPFEIERFFPCDNQTPTSPSQYFVNVLSSFTSIVTLVPPMQQSTTTNSDGMPTIMLPALPREITWQEFECLAADQLRRFGPCDMTPFQYAPPIGVRGEAQMGAPPVVGGSEEPSLDDLLGPPPESELDLDSLLPSLDHIPPTQYPVNPPQQPKWRWDEKHKEENTTNINMEDVSNEVRSVGRINPGRVDVPDSPLMLLLQAIHRLLMLRGEPLPVQQLEDEFRNMWGVRFDATIFGAHNLTEFLHNFPDVFILSEDYTIAPSVSPDFRKVAERISRVCPPSWSSPLHNHPPNGAITNCTAKPVNGKSTSRWGVESEQPAVCTSALHSQARTLLLEVEAVIADFKNIAEKGRANLESEPREPRTEVMECEGANRTGRTGDNAGSQTLGQKAEDNSEVAKQLPSVSLMQQLMDLLQASEK